MQKLPVTLHQQEKNITENYFYKCQIQMILLRKKKLPGARKERERTSEWQLRLNANGIAGPD